MKNEATVVLPGNINPDVITATTWVGTTDGRSDPRRNRETRGIAFEIRTDLLDGIVNSRDRIVVSVEIKTERWCSRSFEVITPNVTWTRHDLYENKPRLLRQWIEAPVEVADREAAHGALDALFSALTADLSWIHAINDRVASSLSEGLAKGPVHMAGDAA